MYLHMYNDERKMHEMTILQFVTYGITHVTCIHYICNIWNNTRDMHTLYL